MTGVGRRASALGPAVVLAVALASTPATAQSEPMDAELGGGADDREAIEQRVNLRVGGASTDDNGRPTICAEVRAWRGISVEACGTGSGILHHQSGGEMAHFRALWRFWSRDLDGSRLGFRGGAGFAELEVGDDKPGFQFGRPGDRASVAGPEASLSVQWLVPLGKGIELVGTGTAGAAWFSGAGDLVVPQEQWQPFVSLDLGVGW